MPAPVSDLFGVPRELTEMAARILEWRGHVDDLDDDEWDRLLTELALVARAAGGHWCTGPDGYVDKPDHIADHWIAIRTEAWERQLPTWACDCGRVFKLLDGVQGYGGRETQFYEVDDGCLGDLAGDARRLANGKWKGTGACPGCGKPFTDTLASRAAEAARRADPQMSLF